VCDRVGILDRGHLVTEGPLDELLDRYALPVYRLDPEGGQGEAVDRLAARLYEADWTTDVALEHGRLKVTVSDPVRAARELLPAVVVSGVTLVSYERVRPTLEDVFLQLVGAQRGGSGMTGLSPLLRGAPRGPGGPCGCRWSSRSSPSSDSSPAHGALLPEILELALGRPVTIRCRRDRGRRRAPAPEEPQFGALAAIILAMGAVASERSAARPPSS
jgi:hypothetical protein